MKTKWLLPMLLIAGLIFSVTAQVQASSRSRYRNDRYSNFGLGLLKPADARTGLLLHLAYGRRLDQTIFYGGRLDFYNRSFEELGWVQGEERPGWEQTSYRTKFESHLLLFSPQAELGANFRIAGKSWQPLLKASLGLDLLHASEENHQTNSSDSRLYIGWSWNLTGGVRLLLGDYSFLTGEIGYHYGRPGREEKQHYGLPVRTEINTSGLIMKLGINYTFKKSGRR